MKQNTLSSYNAISHSKSKSSEDMNKSVEATPCFQLSLRKATKMQVDKSLDLEWVKTAYSNPQVLSGSILDQIGGRENVILLAGYLSENLTENLNLKKKELDKAEKDTFESAVLQPGLE